MLLHSRSAWRHAIFSKVWLTRSTQYRMIFIDSHDVLFRFFYWWIFCQKPQELDLSFSFHNERSWRYSLNSRLYQRKWWGFHSSRGKPVCACEQRVHERCNVAHTTTTENWEDVDSRNCHDSVLSGITITLTNAIAHPTYDLPVGVNGMKEKKGLCNDLSYSQFLSRKNVFCTVTTNMFQSNLTWRRNQCITMESQLAQSALSLPCFCASRYIVDACRWCHCTNRF